MGDKLNQPTKDKLSESLERSRKALKQDDVSEVRSAYEELQAAYTAAGASIYQQQAAASGAGADAGFSGGATAGAGFDDDATAQAARPQDDVVEADYEIVEDEKK